MGRLQDWGAAARRSPVFWVAAAVVVVGLAAGGVVLATSGTAPPPPAPATSNRAVAFGDSVPYGHGLANPYLTPQVGLPPRAISQGPSALAYPSLVAQDLGLTMTVRPTNCRLVGDQLAVSGAVADPADNTAPDGQCPLPRRPARNLDDEVAAARLAERPAHLVLLQDGADDIDFSACLVYELARVLGAGVGLGTPCLGANGTPTPQLTRQLANVRTSLARAIEDIAPHTARLTVLDYYQPLPAPSQIASGTAASGMHTNLVCTGLKANANGAYAAAQVVLADLNRAITGAVADARAHDVRNVTSRRPFDGDGRPWPVHDRPVGVLRRTAARRHAGGRCGPHPGGEGLQRDGRAAQGDVLCSAHGRGHAGGTVSRGLRVACGPPHGGRATRHRCRRGRPLARLRGSRS